MFQTLLWLSKGYSSIHFCSFHHYPRISFLFILLTHCLSLPKTTHAHTHTHTITRKLWASRRYLLQPLHTTTGQITSVNQGQPMFEPAKFYTWSGDWFLWPVTFWQWVALFLGHKCVFFYNSKLAFMDSENCCGQKVSFFCITDCLM